MNFNLSVKDVRRLKSSKVNLSYLFEYLFDGETPGRVLTDYAIKSVCKALEGDHTIYEIGGAGDYYKKFFGIKQEYIVTNIDSSVADCKVDALSMPFETSTVSAMASHFALEHIYEYEEVINEIFRCLKPGGRFLLSVPFLYHYHGAPDDYFRFTGSALNKLLSKFTILKSASFGNKWLVIAQLLHEKRVLGSKNIFIIRLLLRLLGLPFLLRGLIGNQNEQQFAITQLWLVQKP